MIPHSSAPIVDSNGAATEEMRGFMDYVYKNTELRTTTTTLLEDISASINIYDKYQFKIEANTTTGRFVYASGSDPSDVWLYFDGTTAHTPV